MASPMLLYLGILVYTVGIAFEVAQNSADRWYLVEPTRSIADGVFNSLMGVGFALVAIGCSDNVWLRAAMVLFALVFPITYYKDMSLGRPLMGWLQIGANVGLYLAFGDHVVLLHLLFTFVGVFFLIYLFKTFAQWLHGLAAATFTLAILAWPLAMWRFAEGHSPSWLVTGGGAAVALLILGVFFPLAKNAQATPRKEGTLVPPTGAALGMQPAE
jgi:hypothetical protein